mmetsp:Transcript_26656/g.41718  ORF Transcript_26656/g.41718 Transcript_26656/m.41718 type:complete len:361 (+) Transcript_26656:1508-2590(+)
MQNLREARLLAQTLGSLAAESARGWTLRAALSHRGDRIKRRVLDAMHEVAKDARTRWELWGRVSVKGRHLVLKTVLLSWFRGIIVLDRVERTLQKLKQKCLLAMAEHACQLLMVANFRRTSTLKLKSRVCTQWAWVVEFRQTTELGLKHKFLLNWAWAVATRRAEDEGAEEARGVCLQELEHHNRLLAKCTDVSNLSLARSTMRTWGIACWGERELAAQYHYYATLAYKAFCVLSLASAISPSRICQGSCLLCNSNQVEAETSTLFSRSAGPRPHPEDTGMWNKFLYDVRSARRPSCPFLKTRLSDAPRFIKHMKELYPTPTVSPVKSMEAKARAASQILAFRSAVFVHGSAPENATIGA